MKLDEIVKPNPWWARLVELAVITICAIAVLMFLASDPSYDEIEKGVAAGFFAFVVGQFKLPGTN
jgi:hypothetical protein